VPTATNDGVDCYYETSGRSVGGREPVAFVGDAGYGAWQWGWQHRAVAGPRPVVVYDHRGTGRSDAPPGPYAPSDLVGDLGAVLGAAGIARPHLVGAGVGGLVALRAARSGAVTPRSLVLLGTAAAGQAPEADALRGLYASPDDRPALRRATRRALSDAFVEAQPDVVERIVDWRAAEDAAPAAVDAQLAAARGIDLGDELYEVTTPALVIHGGADAAWPIASARSLAAGLPRGELVEADGAGHLVGVERSKLVGDRLAAFLAATESDPGST
jgi:pimeloyl-ACP methyl ester carboxylesterase